MPKGHVKWFNNGKGFGFIISEESPDGNDLFAHYSQIQMEGYKTLKSGQEVEFEVAEGKDGYAAINISAVEVCQGVPVRLTTRENVSHRFSNTREEV
jgi:CspA family cold shock protein